jgi:hypothetical protein
MATAHMNRISTATTALASFGILASLVMFIAFYASVTDVSWGNRILGCLTMSCWSAAPYVAVLLAAYRCKSNPILAVVWLLSSIVIVALAVYVSVEVIAKPGDGQAGFALVFMPIAQWLLLSVAIVVSAANSLYFCLAGRGSG